MTTNDHRGAALETVLAYHRAWTSGDLDGAMAYVVDDIILPGARRWGWPL